PAEPVVHGLLFAAPVGRTTQDHGLPGDRIARELDLDAVLDLTPVLGVGEGRSEPLQLRFRCADDVTSATLAQPSQIIETAMPRSAIQTRPSTPCRASIVVTIVCKVRESCVLPANTS